MCNCKKPRTAKYYYRTPNTMDRLTRDCKACIKEANRKDREIPPYIKALREKALEGHRKRIQTHLGIWKG